MTNAAKSGSFSIGGKTNVHRLGFGAMRIVGDGVWGPPKDKAEALATLRRVPELGVDFIDTADAYGPEISEDLIREALHPYDGLLIATKGGLTRSGPEPLGAQGRSRLSDRCGEEEPRAAQGRHHRALATASHRSQGAAGRAIRRHQVPAR